MEVVAPNRKQQRILSRSQCGAPVESIVVVVVVLPTCVVDTEDVRVGWKTKETV